MRRSSVLLFMLAVFVAGLIAACGGGADTKATTTPAAGKAGTAAATATSFPADSSMAAIVKSGKLRIGVKYDVPLFGLLDPTTKKVDGFDVAIGKEIAKALGLNPETQVEFVEAISANRIPFLQEDKVDLTISTMTINEDRKKQIEFSRPYYLAGQSILVKADNTSIKSVKDLNGKKVCSAQGSTSEQNVVKADNAPQAQMTSLTTYSACVAALKDGRVEAVSTDDIILAGFAAQDKSLKLTGGTFTTEAYGIGIKKGRTDLQKFVDGVLGDMLKDGRWEKLYGQYIGQAPGLPAAPEAKTKLPASA
jgi:glutamate transport system substrate-binding protein